MRHVCLMVVGMVGMLGVPSISWANPPENEFFEYRDSAGRADRGGM